jgi:hypothetical protein
MVLLSVPIGLAFAAMAMYPSSAMSPSSRL